MNSDISKAPAVKNAVQIMEAICASETNLGVSEISRLTGINKNMAFRILKTLVEEEWVIFSKEDGSYQMSLRPFHYFSKPVGRMDIKTAAQPALHHLWRQAGQFTYLGIPDGGGVLFLEALNPTRGNIRISGNVGGRYPLYCSAPGKVILAWGKGGENQMPKGMKKQTLSTLTTPKELRQECAEIRARGYALDREESARGLICLAGPVFDAERNLVGSIGISSLTLYFTLDELENKFGIPVLEACRESSCNLGCDRGLFDSLIK